MLRDEIAEKHYDLAIRIAKRIAESEGMEEGDLTGPAFEGLLRGAESLATYCKDESNPEPFLNTAIRNSIIDFVRKERKRGFTDVAADDVILPLISLQEPIGQDSEQVVEDTIASQSYDLTELKAEIAQTIDHIPLSYRAIFRLKLEDPDITNLEISYRTGLSISDIEQRISRGRKYLVGK